VNPLLEGELIIRALAIGEIWITMAQVRDPFKISTVVSKIRLKRNIHWMTL